MFESRSLFLPYICIITLAISNKNICRQRKKRVKALNEQV